MMMVVIMSRRWNPSRRSVANPRIGRTRKPPALRTAVLVVTHDGLPDHVFKRPMVGWRKTLVRICSVSDLGDAAQDLPQDLTIALRSTGSAGQQST